MPDQNELPDIQESTAVNAGQYFPIDTVAPRPRSWRRRLWSRLGFGARCVALTPGYDVANYGWAAGMISTTTYLHFDFRDRLRLLISGVAALDERHHTEIMVGRVESISAAGVMPPGSKLGKDPNAR